MRQLALTLVRPREPPPPLLRSLFHRPANPPAQPACPPSPPRRATAPARRAPLRIRSPPPQRASLRKRTHRTSTLEEVWPDALPRLRNNERRRGIAHRSG